MAKKLPFKRRVEEAIAGYLIDRQAADSTFLPGPKAIGKLPIICAHTSRAPDDPVSGKDDAVTPPPPYLTVYCGKAIDAPDWPNGYGIKHAFVMLTVKTQSDDEGRQTADDRTCELESVIEDRETALAALNIPADPATPDTRRVKDLYIYDFLDVEDDDLRDNLSALEWEDAIIWKVLAQNYDPER